MPVKNSVLLGRPTISCVNPDSENRNNYFCFVAGILSSADVSSHQTSIIIEVAPVINCASEIETAFLEECHDRPMVILFEQCVTFTICCDYITVSSFTIMNE